MSVGKATCQWPSVSPHGWRGRLACAVAAASQESCADVQHTPARPRLRRGGPAGRRQRRAGGLVALDAGTQTLGEYVTGT